MRIDQLVPAFHRGDAIGDTALHMKKYFLSRGFQSEIYCLSRDKGLEKSSRLFSEYQIPRPTDITILHFALPSPLSKAFVDSPSRKAIIYHNLTPKEFFTDFSHEMERISRTGREELESLVPHVTVALADSEFNRKELVSLGFQRTEVFPLFIDFEKYDQPMSRFFYTLFDDERTNILFVGRIVPNKKIEDLIRVLFTYKKYVSPLVRLIVVGKTSSLPVYFQSLIRFADEFYLRPEEICFTGHIPDEEMFALYKVADVFLSLSEHEGFGLPFIESMVFDLPIIAYDCTAVPYTLDGAGVLIKEKRVEYVSELINYISHDQEVRQKVIQGQRQRLRKFKEKNVRDFLGRIISDLKK